MSGEHPVFIILILLIYFAILQLLSWNVEAYWENNHTLINLINSMNTSWNAGENPTEVPSRLSERRPRKRSAPVLKSEIVPTPNTFDSRLHWKNCSGIISRIRSQGRCGSCWAIVAASVLSDRICIETKGNQRVHLSSEDVISCCDFCKAKNQTSCDGGYPEDAVNFWIRRGIVTGGELDSNEGCKPYSLNSHRGRNVPCETRCANNHYQKKYMEDKHKGKTIYRVQPHEDAIRSEIFTNGPVIAILIFYDDFHQYRGGVYRHVLGNRRDAHAVKIIGWGKERGVKYWLAANSYGKEFGLKGYIKLVRGENHCKIEQWVVGARMSKSLHALGTIRRTAFSRADDTRSHLVQMLPIYSFYIRIIYGMS